MYVGLIEAIVGIAINRRIKCKSLNDWLLYWNVINSKETMFLHLKQKQVNGDSNYVP